MALGLVPEILDAVDVISGVGKEPGMVDAEMVEVRYVQHIVTLPAVRIDNAVGHDLALDDGDQSGPGCVGDNLGIDLPTPLKQAKYGDFPRCAAPALSFPPATEVTLVHFDLAAEHGLALGFQFQSNDLAQAEEKERSCLAVYSAQAGSR